MREFDKELFLGDGDYSELRVKVLKKRLSDGITLLCGMQ